MADRAEKGLVDLSHVIDDGMTTYKGLPGPHICDFWTREASAANYDDGSTFQIGRIDMVANTGTYVDSPFHRYADGKDLSDLPLGSLANLEGVVVSQPYEQGLAIDADVFGALDVRGMAVLIATGWDRYWRTETYFADHPFLTEAAAQRLVEGGAAFVGIDSYNIDDTRVRARPVHRATGREYSDRRASGRSRPASRTRFSIFGRAAQDQGHGHIPGSRLRGN
jgi:kynurenine formamidase